MNCRQPDWSTTVGSHWQSRSPWQLVERASSCNGKSLVSFPTRKETTLLATLDRRHANVNLAKPAQKTLGNAVRIKWHKQNLLRLLHAASSFNISTVSFSSLGLQATVGRAWEPTRSVSRLQTFIKGNKGHGAIFPSLLRVIFAPQWIFIPQGTLGPKHCLH